MKPGLPAVPPNEPSGSYEASAGYDPSGSDDPRGSYERGSDAPNIDVGEFRQGSPFSQWALARYLVGRAIVESMGWALLCLVVVLVALAAVAEYLLHTSVLAVLIVVIAVGVVVMRWVLLTVVRRLTGFAHYGVLEQRMKSLVDDTSSDVLRELRRIGLPGRVWTLPLLAIRFLTRDRRRDTVAKLKRFDVQRTVPKARLDEMHLLVRTAVGGDTGWAGPANRPGAVPPA